MRSKHTRSTAVLVQTVATRHVARHTAQVRRLLISICSSSIVAIAIARPRRFVVTDRSMEPTLVDGQGLVAIRWPWVRSGQLRCVEHPHRVGFWLVKRVVSVDGDRMVVGSDNDAVDAVDSRRFGAVPTARSFLVALRVPQRWM